MKVTDKEFQMENRLVSKLDLMVTRLKGTDDNVVVIDGDEGQGKSNLAAGICYYVAYKSGREYKPENIFFDLDKLISFAATTKDKVIHWDEAALGGMSQQWWKKNQIRFIQLLMTARKKRHFIVLCIPKFYKLNEYIMVDRAIALIHVYSRQNIHKGRFFYYTKGKKELLYEDWRKAHKRNYLKRKSFGGAFKEYMDNYVFDEQELKEYDKMKDKAIADLAQPTEQEKKAEELDIKIRIFGETYEKLKETNGITIKKLAEAHGIHERTGDTWMKKYREHIKATVPVVSANPTTT